MTVGRQPVGQAFSLTISGNNAIALNGSSQYGTIPNFASIDALSSYTFEFWANESSTATTGSTFIRMQNGGTRYNNISNDNGRDDISHTADYSTNDAFGGNSGVIFTNNAYHHFAWVFNSSSKTVSNYVDGVLISNSFSQTGSGTLLGFVGANILMGFNNSSTYFKGNFANLRLWNVVRTLADIQANMNYYLDPSQENLGGKILIGNWNFNQGTGTTVENTSSSGTGDLALTGTPSWTTGPTLTTKNYGTPRTTAGTRTVAGTRTLITS